ncbi:MAG: hypothetical protein LRY25_00135 [Flavobacterium sp.]|nr:hypothetical protein [Flavobacterium sp.]
MKLGIQLIFGAKVDEPATRLFLPYEFKEAISYTKVNGNAIEKSNKRILEVSKTEVSFNWMNSIYSLIAILLALVLANKKWIQISYFVFRWIIGIVFLFSRILFLTRRSVVELQHFIVQSPFC